MNRYLIIVTLVCLIIWTAVGQWTLGDSRQTCESIQSVETCAWELR